MLGAAKALAEDRSITIKMPVTAARWFRSRSPESNIPPQGPGQGSDKEGPFPSRLTRVVAITASWLAAFLVSPPGWAGHQDRVVLLRAQGDLSRYRVQIRNSSTKPITFTLGFNDQLFENEDSLLANVLSSATCTCGDLDAPEDAKVPCAAYERVASALTHFPELGINGWAQKPRLWFESPMLAINSFGFGTCGTLADVLAKLWKALGYPTRRRNLNGHTVTEVQIRDRWLLFDADLRGHFAAGGHILGIDDLVEDPGIAQNPAVVHGLPGVRAGDFPRAGLYYYTDLLLRSTGKWLDVSDVPDGPDDWRELTVTLPPGSRLLFPEESRSRCLFPEHTDFAQEYGDLTDPPYQYAVIDVPAGTVSDIQNGLFPLYVTGSYCLTAVYDDSTETTQDFDQVYRFKYSRRFAREFGPLEAYSDVSIYYMLTSNVSVRGTSEVRIHGDGIDQLDVRLVAPSPTGIPPVTPCLESSRRAVPVRKISASSNSHGNNKQPENLIDGKLLTAWDSELLQTAEPQQIVLDLGKPAVIGGIRWAPHYVYGMLSPSAVIVGTSLNGKDYREVVRVTDYRPQFVEWLERDFEPRVARYVELILIPVPHFLVAGRFQVGLAAIEVLPPSVIKPAVASVPAPPTQ